MFDHILSLADPGLASWMLAHRRDTEAEIAALMLPPSAWEDPQAQALLVVLMPAAVARASVAPVTAPTVLDAVIQALHAEGGPDVSAWLDTYRAQVRDLVANWLSQPSTMRHARAVSTLVQHVGLRVGSIVGYDDKKWFAVVMLPSGEKVGGAWPISGGVGGMPIGGKEGYHFSLKRIAVPIFIGAQAKDRYNDFVAKLAQYAPDVEPFPFVKMSERPDELPQGVPASDPEPVDVTITHTPADGTMADFAKNREIYDILRHAGFVPHHRDGTIRYASSIGKATISPRLGMHWIKRELHAKGYTVAFDIEEAETEEERAAAREARSAYLIGRAEMKEERGYRKLGQSGLVSRAAIAEAKQAIRLSPIEGYYPTPPELVERLISQAALYDLPEDALVLEPSAGDGAIVKAIAETAPEVGIVAVEIHRQLAELTRETGQAAVIQRSIFDFHPGSIFTRILMNPPFEREQDIDHVRAAWDLLAPGGRLVAIMSGGTGFKTDRKATGFRAWVEAQGGTIEKLPAATFGRATVSTILVTLDKPDAAPETEGATADVEAIEAAEAEATAIRERPASAPSGGFQRPGYDERIDTSTEWGRAREAVSHWEPGQPVPYHKSPRAQYRARRAMERQREKADAHMRKAIELERKGAHDVGVASTLRAMAADALVPEATPAEIAAGKQRRKAGLAAQRGKIGAIPYVEARDFILRRIKGKAKIVTGIRKGFTTAKFTGLHGGDHADGWIGCGPVDKHAGSDENPSRRTHFLRCEPVEGGIRVSIKPEGWPGQRGQRGPEYGEPAPPVFRDAVVETAEEALDAVVPMVQAADVWATSVTPEQIDALAAWEPPGSAIAWKWHASELQTAIRQIMPRIGRRAEVESAVQDPRNYEDQQGATKAVAAIDGVGDLPRIWVSVDLPAGVRDSDYRTPKQPGWDAIIFEARDQVLRTARDRLVAALRAETGTAQGPRTNPAIAARRRLQRPAHLTPDHAVASSDLAAIRATLAGEGERLGAGNFGATYRVRTPHGSRVVKLPAAHDVHGHAWDPADLRGYFLHEAGVANELERYPVVPLTAFADFPPASQVPAGVLPGASFAIVREYGEVPAVGETTPAEFATLEARLVQLEADTGWRIKDDLLILRRPSGELYLGDVGWWQAPEDVTDDDADLDWLVPQAAARVLGPEYRSMPTLSRLRHEADRWARDTASYRAKHVPFTEETATTPDDLREVHAYYPRLIQRLAEGVKASLAARDRLGLPVPAAIRAHLPRS